MARDHDALPLPLLLLLLLPVPSSSLTSAQEGGYVPPRFQRGQFPAIHPNAQNGGLVAIELQIAASGIVTDASVVDDAPPFTEAIVKMARLWSYRSATRDGRPVASRASVVALFRPPTLLGAETPPPARPSRPSGEVPYPTNVVTPTYPPNALFEGVVAIEVEVDASGAVANAEILHPAEGFDSVALEAAKQFRFEPAKREGHPFSAFAVVIFGFAQPVTGRRPR
jgi:TonB family protein